THPGRWDRKHRVQAAQLGILIALGLREDRSEVSRRPAEYVDGRPEHRPPILVDLDARELESLHLSVALVSECEVRRHRMVLVPVERRGAFVHPLAVLKTPIVI